MLAVSVTCSVEVCRDSMVVRDELHVTDDAHTAIQGEETMGMTSLAHYLHAPFSLTSQFFFSWGRVIWGWLD